MALFDGQYHESLGLQWGGEQSLVAGHGSGKTLKARVRGLRTRPGGLASSMAHWKVVLNLGGGQSVGLVGWKSRGRLGPSVLDWDCLHFWGTLQASWDL